MDEVAPKPIDGVVFTPLPDGTATLLHLASSTLYELNATGCIVWRGLSEGGSASDIAQVLARAHDLDPLEARAAVDAFVADLGGAGLLEVGRRK